MLHLLIAQTLHPLLQLVVDEEREELRTPLVQVEEVLKVAGDDLRISQKATQNPSEVKVQADLLEELVVAEGVVEEAVEPVLEL